MSVRHLLPAAFFACTTVFAGARAEDIQRLPLESDAAFVARVLHVPADRDLRVIAASWNGAPTL